MQNASPSLLDRFFAKRTLAAAYTEERALFLARLMEESRRGHLCWKPDGEAPAFPSSIVAGGESLCPKTPVVLDGGRYYLQRNWVYESYLLSQVDRLRVSEPAPFYDKKLFEKELSNCEALQPEQRIAIASAFENPFSIICGGPGTGKTYTAALLVRLLLASVKKEKRKSFKLILSASTGKAASHLQSVLLGQGNLGSFVKTETTTLHRLLKLQPGENRLFQKRRIDADFVLIDEASMLDAPLLAHLFESIGNGTRLVLLGDPDQLPPVESGSLFPEMASLFGSHLKRSMRVEASDLQQFAKAILESGSEEMERLLKVPSPSLEHLNWPFDAALQEKLFKMADPFISNEKPDPEKSISQLNRFRILGSLRQGPYGVDELNRQILHEAGRRVQPGQWWAVPILITSNEPRLELYNGSCGILIGKSSRGIHLREGTAYFSDFETGGVRSFSNLPPFEIAFCLSIHKSQGSEFEKVLALFPPGSEHFGREAIYTAATRAKKELRLVGDKEVLKKMIAKRSLKISGFTERYRTPKK